MPCQVVLSTNQKPPDWRLFSSYPLTMAPQTESNSDLFDRGDYLNSTTSFMVTTTAPFGE